MLLFKELTRFKIKPILSTTEEAVIYLCDDSFKFELIIVGSGDTDGLMKIRLVKNYRVKIVIIDIDSSTDRYMDYDYKIVRPIDTSKILNVLNLIFIGSNKQNTHNKFFDSSSDSVDSPTHIKSSILNNIKVLYSEDNKQNQKVMTILLNSMGIHNIVLANDGFEAYDKLLNEDFDIALIDLKMPIMNGIDVVTKFLHTCKKSTILIAVTASVTEDIRKKCQHAGMHGFVAKPICYNDLESIINSAVSNKLKKLNSSFYN
jgi:CheY-like chemotaxis protein